jgi:outer membrane protein OmpA-like peptidoglycan-associated protein
VVASIWTPALSVAAGSRASLSVDCALTAGLVSRCQITLLTVVSGRQVEVGRALVTVAARTNTRHVRVLVPLNSLGRALAAQPGGIRVHVASRINRRGARTIMRPGRDARVVMQSFIVPRPVFFASDRSTLRPAEIAYLTRLRTQLRGVRSISCQGFADGESTPGYNIRLGAARANVVCAFLARGNHITVLGSSLGEGHPHATNATARGRALNRRTEIRFGY